MITIWPSRKAEWDGFAIIIIVNRHVAPGSAQSLLLFENCFRWLLSRMSEAEGF